MELRPYRLAVRTPGSHPGNPGSIPGGVTKKTFWRIISVFFYDLSLSVCLTTSIKFRGVISALIGYPSTRFMTDLREASSCLIVLAVIYLPSICRFICWQLAYFLLYFT